MAAVDDRYAAVSLIEALGLAGPVTAVTIRLEVGAPPTVEVVSCLDQDCLERATRLFRLCRLVPVEDGGADPESP